ncbi:hypothetical protein B0G52_13065 [Cohnella sp. SGD-V74]|jgi:hypothetical protein|nr:MULTISPECIES: hypothetical protein [unclassified Cohnella]PRX59855.1 hypothetical protein B0G52_13065 [Cohnella sp. SGD-V74]
MIEAHVVKTDGLAPDKRVSPMRFLQTCNVWELHRKAEHYSCRRYVE